jgi:SAM-dependent methyltransferase
MTNWDQLYRENETPWDRGEPAPPLVEYVESHTLTGHALVPGCGIGHDARFLAEQGCSVHGIDISDTALGKAKSIHDSSGLYLKFENVDFLCDANGLPNSHFDLLFEHTCFCAINPSDRARYAKAARKVLKPNGLLLGIFFTDMENANGPPYPSSRYDIQSLFSPNFEIVNVWKPARSFPGREGEDSMYLMKRL